MIDNKYDKWLAESDSITLALFIARYECWLREQLKQGGLIFPPSDYWKGFEQSSM